MHTPAGPTAPNLHRSGRGVQTPGDPDPAEHTRSALAAREAVQATGGRAGPAPGATLG